MSSQSAIDLCNRALVRIGATRITDFTGGSAESETAAAEYEPFVIERLTGVTVNGMPHVWHFAKKIASLGVPTSPAPLDKWAYAYNLPNDLLAIRAARRNDAPIVFDRVGNQLLCDEDDGVILEYTFRQAEAEFPSYFTAALVEDLASVFALALARDDKLSAAFQARASGLWVAAALSDSQARTPQTMRAGRLVAARR